MRGRVEPESWAGLGEPGPGPSTPAGLDIRELGAPGPGPSTHTPHSIRWLVNYATMADMGSKNPPYLSYLDHCLTEAGDFWRRPDFSGEPVIHVVSDYAGPPRNSNSRSKFRTYSFLFTAGLTEIEKYKHRVEEIRRRNNIDADMALEYKAIHKSPELLRALPEIVDAINALKGIIFTLVVETDLDSIFGDAQENHRARAGRVMTVGTLERALRIGYSLAYWLARLVDEGQTAVWLGDRDDVWINDAIRQEFDNLLNHALVTTGYRGRAFGNPALFYIVESDANKPSRDLLTIPDLVAGSIVRVMSDIRDDSPRPKEGIDSLLDIGGDHCDSLSHVIYRAKSKNGGGELLKFPRMPSHPGRP